MLITGSMSFGLYQVMGRLESSTNPENCKIAGTGRLRSWVWADINRNGIGK